MPSITSFLNQKSGVGKTTTAVTLSSGFARRGYWVLLFDLDTQGNVADSFGLLHGDDLRWLLSPDFRCSSTRSLSQADWIFCTSSVLIRAQLR